MLQSSDLSDRVAVVTGGAGMLGREFCRALSEAKARVAIVDVRKSEAESQAQALQDRTGNEALGIEVDVSDPDSVCRMTDIIVGHWGRLDILVNNAALDPKLDASAETSPFEAFENYPLHLWKRSLDVNLTGAFLCSQSAGKQMLLQEGGTIVNIASIYGLTAPDQRLYRKSEEAEQTRFKPVDYAVSKAGILHLTRYLAAYWGDKNIRVNSITPGGVRHQQDEEFVNRYSQRAPLGRMAATHDMNGALMFLISEGSSYVTGANLVVDGGWSIW